LLLAWRLFDGAEAFGRRTAWLPQLLGEVQPGGARVQVFGYKGKQVRDNIHSEDVAAFMFAFYQKPRIAEVYNLGGGKANSCSIIEAFAMTAEFTGKKQRYSYVDENRAGDHIVYYSDLRKM
jgi:CDP-paratose 2-epimerase